MLGSRILNTFRRLPRDSFFPVAAPPRLLRNAVLPSESDFPFGIDGSKLAFIGVVGV